MNGFRLSTVFLGLSIALAACGGDDEPLATPSIAITTPADGAVVGLDDQFIIDIENYFLVEAGSPVQPDEGHIHVFVDGEYTPITTADFKLVELRESGTFLPGNHEIRVILVDSEHTPREGLEHTINITLSE